MTDEPPDPKFSDAAAAYRSARNLRQPRPAPQIVRLVDEADGPAPTNPAQPHGAASPGVEASPSSFRQAGVSLMITNAQKDGLRRLGVTEDELRDMTPAEAHRRLGLSSR